MLLVTDELLQRYIEVNNRLNLNEFLNKKIFTVSDTPLTYRQINSLATDNLLINDRKNKLGWRKFSFKELVYILIIRELKKFGLNHEQLRPLWEAFFKNPTKNKLKKLELNKGVGEIAIGAVFGQVEIKINIDNRGNVIFYDPNHSFLVEQLTNSQITIRLNDFVNDLLQKMGRNPIPIRWSTSNFLMENLKDTTPKEDELIKIIRDKNYSAVRIKKKNGEIYLIYAETVNGTNSKTTARDILKIINSRDYQDINIVKRDGRIVNYKIEELIKL